MKGIIFTEFLALVETKFGLDELDHLLLSAGDEGVYTTVGSYDHKLLVKLIVQLSKQTGISADDLQRVFGQSVFNNLYNTLPPSSSMQSCRNTFQFIKLVEDYIHIEVKKLYPEANPPKFHFVSETASELIFDYKSARCMSSVCIGLVEGCAEHFNEGVNVVTQTLSDDGSQVRFTVSLVENP